MVRGIPKCAGQSGDSRSGLQGNNQILEWGTYEHRLDICRASRGATETQKWLCPALDAGFFIFGKHFQAKDLAGRQRLHLRRVKSRQTSPRDPGAFRWNRKKTFFDNRKAGKFTPITLILITVGRGAMVWIITSSARVEQYCG